MDILTPNPDSPEVLDEVDYGVDTCDFIRDKLAGYAGGSAIAGEMIQNADDARASIIRFYFRPDALIVNNNSHFTEQDFKNIVAIASGEKRDEVGKIGTWGTGFISVYHLTDKPELESAGKRIVFDPNKHRLPRYRSKVQHGTIFRLPWRRQKTELSRKLEADVWQEEDISRLKDQLAVDIYRLVLFLRHVRTIEVYEGETGEKLIARVERRPIKEQKHSTFTCEQWEIEYKRAGVQSRTDTWLYYRGHIPLDKRPAGVTIKDTEIALAFPVESRDWLAQNVPGSLYNFLPTPIETGLPFQINGAFFPDNNRQSILLDPNTQREKSAWNRHVLAQLGRLFADIVLDIRDQVAEPRRFYELLPVLPPNEDFLKSVRQPFIEKASELPIVKTSLGSWERPGKVFIGRRGSRLPELAAAYLPVLPTGVPQEFRDFLEKELQTPTLKIKDVLDYLRPALKAGMALSSAHPMINNREKLEILYGEISGPVSENILDLADFAICLAEDQTLWPFNKLWRADKATRRLVAGTDIRFVEIRTQEKFRAWLGKLVGEFKGAELVEWLGKQTWPEIGTLNTGLVGQLKQIGAQLSKWFQPSPSDHKQDSTPLTLAEPPSFIRDAKHLADILQFIAQDLSRVNPAILSRLPLVRSETDYLLYPHQLYRHDNPDERATLKKLGLHFVYADWSKNRAIWAVYEQAGVKHLEPSDVIDTLGEVTSRWTEEPDDELIAYLLSLYQYFERCRLEEKDKIRLRRLPLCVTQNGHLISAQGGKVIPHLPSSQESKFDQQIRQHLDKLQLDNLVHSQLIARGKRFLTDILLLEALSPARLIETVIVPHYLDPRLDDTARQDLLNYISKQLQDMPEGQQRALFPKLLDKPLIRCADGEYRPARSVYFASPALDTVFANGYHKLHPDYGVPVAQPDAPDQTPYRRSTWYWLFEHLGVNEHPTPADLVRAVREVVTAGPPTEARVEAVRRVYDLLNREAGKGRLEQDDELKELAEFAWLPAKNDTAQWFFPKALYHISQEDFIGNQAPVLKFGDPTRELRRLLRMPDFPPVSVVAKHLLESASKGIEVKRRVYDDLGRRWQDLNSELQSRLKNEAVVWGGEKFWLAKHVFLGDYSQQFGRRRCYLKPPGGDAQEFLVQLGVRPSPHPWKDSLALLEEIAGDYNESKPVSDDDRRLLFSNFDYLGRQLQGGHKNTPADLERLRRLAIVPDRGGILRRPNRVVIADQSEILKQFDSGAIPVVNDEELSESAYRFLLALGVPKLSQIVHRTPVDTTGSKEDSKFSLHIQQLIPAFQRIALTLQEKQNYSAQTDLPKERLKNVRLCVCKKLVVEYVLDDGQGWRIQGHRRSEEALYFAGDMNILYLKQINPNKLPFIALARELERILFPDSKESVVIEQLLQKPLPQVDGYLDEHGYRRLYSDEAPVEQMESSQEGLVGWTDAEEGPAPWEEEEAVTEEPASATGQEDFFQVLERDTEVEAPGVSRASAGESEPEKQPDREAEPSTETGPPIPKSEVESKIAGSDAVPPFTGMRWPISIRQPNDYARLSEEFGLPPDINEGNGPLQISEDTEWEPPQPKEEERDATTDHRITTVRFTLTYQNRYEGFLPLHSRARQMLADQPQVLTCQTDYPDEWTFNLYVDYNNPGMIYNQDRLPQFFEAFNIPAGGIVYLERLEAHNTVRLFWKNTQQVIHSVRRYELTEGGKVEEFLTDVTAPCEVNEHIVRAETRLEDIGAFIQKSIGQPGVFELICDAFGRSGVELSYDDIFDYVQKKRPVADFSIRAELYARPCFVSLEDGRWRFEPKRGLEPVQNTRHQEVHRLPGSSTDGQPEPTIITTGSEDALPVPSKSYDTPYHRLFEDIKQELSTLSALLQLDGNEPHPQLERLSQGLITLGQRLQADLAALSQNQPREDDLLTVLWQKLLQAPQNMEAQQNLQRYLAEQIRQTDNFMKQIEYQLANTPYVQRDFVFPMLSRLAGEMAEQGHISLARQLYNMLQQQSAGNFEGELAQLAQADDVNAYIQLVEVAETAEERWALWHEAWQKYPGFPTLRQAIQKDIKSSVDSARQTIETNLTQSKSQEAFESYLNLIEQIKPFVDAWQTDQNISSLMGGLAQRLFEVFQGNEDYRQALQVVASLPPKTGWSLSGDIYLEAIQGVANEFENRADNLAAAALIDYGIYFVTKNRWPVDDYVLSDAYENTGRLYQNLAMPYRAYDFIKQAQRKSAGERKTKLGRRAYTLNQQRDKAEEQTETKNWRIQIEVLLQNPDFCPLVNPEIFRLFVAEKG